MTVELIIAPEAQQDIEEAYDWFEERRIGLGEDFLTWVGVKSALDPYWFLR